VSILEAVVLGAVQGLTEFIPISSSGHLVVTPALLGWEKPPLSFDVLLHSASLLALLVYFSGDLLDIARGVMHGDRTSRRLVLLLGLGTIPAAVAGIAFAGFFEDQFEDATGAALQLLLTAVILVVAEASLRFFQRRHARTGARLRRMDDLDVVDAGTVGIAQALAIIPGISRSGATIGAGLLRGMERDVAARFAFLLAIPALLGAAIVELPNLGEAPLGVGAAAAGFLASLVASYAAIWSLIRYLKTRTLYPFALYCAVAGPLFAVLVSR